MKTIFSLKEGVYGAKLVSIGDMSIRFLVFVKKENRVFIMPWVGVGKLECGFQNRNPFRKRK